ncbi:MAG: DNA replication/repair protein RecF, partial [Ignavibacteriae bacterium]|nr:DNA replication/repair protein RecF [Ignavibacteriota bacterium]
MSEIFLHKIQVKNFRNLQEQTINIKEGINCIFGKNGNGKTNILEAIYYLNNKKSFRKNTSFPQLLSVDCDKPEIIFNSIYKKKSGTFTYTGKISNKSHSWFKDNRPTKNKTGLLCEFINPFDSFSFHTVPAFRRNWVDQHLAKISKNYKMVLNKYQRIIRQRNVLLSKKNSNCISQIEALDEIISELTIIIIKERKEFFKEIEQYCTATFKNIFDVHHTVILEMKSKFENFSVNNVQKYFNETRQLDIEAGITRYGVHKDDFIFFF